MTENDPTTATAPDHEALLSTVETAGAALVAALEACVAAGLTSAATVASAAKIASTAGMRNALAEQVRPKGPMATITRPRGSQPPTTQGEVERITDASIILRDGSRYSRSDGYRVGGYENKWNRSRIAMDEVARIVATGWTPPKAPRASKACK